jgi:hypothetical protein
VLLLLLPAIEVEEIARPEDEFPVDIEELAVRDDTLEDTTSEFETEEYGLMEVEKYPKISTLKALTKLLVVLEKVPGRDLR